MPPASRPSLPTDPGTLILGPSVEDVDLVLVTLDGQDRDRWEAVVAERAAGRPFGIWGLTGPDVGHAFTIGAAAVGRPIAGATAARLLDDLDTAHRHGGELVLLDDGRSDQVPGIVTELVAAGADPARLVVELALGSPSHNRPAAPPRTPLIAGLVASGVRVGVVLTTRPDGDEDLVSGWEIGSLTDALLSGATLVRGVEVHRARRVRAVVDAIARGGAS